MGYLDYAGLQYLWGKLKEKFAPKSHSHDDRYYTEAEMDGKLTEKLHEETITDARDLNTIKTTGVYHLKTTSYTNGPGILNHATIFVDYTVGTPYQIFISDSVNRAWRRNYVNSNDTWYAWTELKYTDTNTWRGIQNNLTSDSTSDSLSAAQGKVLKGLVDGKAPNGHTHTKDQVGLGNVDNTADANKSVKYATSAGNASKVNNHTVNIDVPANAKFTDTTYGVATASSNGLMSSTDKTKLDDFSRVISIQKQIKLTTDWQDTGIAGNNLETGTYIIQVSGFNSSYTQIYSEMYSGIMTWYADSTNSGNASEIFLHNAGHADNSNAVYLRTLRTARNNYLKLQIACKVAATGTDTLTFKFRRLI